MVGTIVNDLSANLSSVLNEQIRCAEAMLDVLACENQALRDGDTGVLSAATADKARLADSLEKLEHKRRSLTETIGTAASGPTGPGATHSPPEWQTLLGLVAACKTRNEQNGLLLKARGDYVRAAVRLLRGSEPGVYAAGGTLQATPSMRPLGTA